MSLLIPRLASLCVLITILAACGARSELRAPRDASIPDAPATDAIDRIVVPDVRRDVTPDLPIDVLRDVPRDIGTDVMGRVDVVCPAPVQSTQTSTVTLTATARSNLGLPLTSAWTVERRPMESMLAPMPPNAPSTQVTFDTGGEWTLRYTATDPLGNSGTCTVNLFADPAIELLCPQDESNYQGATLSLMATARSRLGRTLTYSWSVESRPTGSLSNPVPSDQLATRFLLDQLGDWQLRLVARDSGGLTASCRVNLHADPDVIVMCPPDTVSRPFATIGLAATASSRLGLPLTYRWEIVERPITSTASIPTPDQLATSFTFDVVGNWTYRFTATNSRGNRAFCTTRARSASDEAVRVEIVWNTDRSCRSCNPEGGGIDIDLHVANVALAMGRWSSNAPSDADCYYANCPCGSPGMLCDMERIDWPPAGRPNNPQQDIDHIRDLPGPENINVRQATDGTQFDVGVHYFSGSEETPVVTRVYCGGTLIYESEPARIAPGGGENPLWWVGRITMTGGSCTFARCGAPGMLGECIRPLSSW